MLDSLTPIRIDKFRRPNYEATVVSNHREIHCMELLNDSRKQKNIEQLKDWFISEYWRINMYSLDRYCSNINNEKHCLSLHKSFEIDEVAKSFMPSDLIPNIAPTVTAGDSSFLYNANLMIWTGTCQLKYELKLKTVKELISN